MREIDLETWPRREHFKVFSGLDYPHFGLCANVDITTLRPFVKQHGMSFTVAVVYLIARAANSVPAFRQRIRSGRVVEHDICHPSTTILTEEDLFSFCLFRYREDFSSFAAEAVQRIAYVKEHLDLDDHVARDELLLMTAIPWVSFTSFLHPINLNPADSIPRFAWGRFFAEGDAVKMPLAVQVHHGVVDGLHVGRFYEAMQAALESPDDVLG